MSRLFTSGGLDQGRPEEFVSQQMQMTAVRVADGAQDLVAGREGLIQQFYQICHQQHLLSGQNFTAVERTMQGMHLRYQNIHGQATVFASIPADSEQPTQGRMRGRFRRFRLVYRLVMQGGYPVFTMGDGTGAVTTQGSSAYLLEALPMLFGFAKEVGGELLEFRTSLNGGQVEFLPVDMSDQALGPRPTLAEGDIALAVVFRWEASEETYLEGDEPPPMPGEAPEDIFALIDGSRPRPQDPPIALDFFPAVTQYFRGVDTPPGTVEDTFIEELPDPR